MGYFKRNSRENDPFFTFSMVYYSMYVKCFPSQDIFRLSTAPFSRKLVQIERFALRTAILNDRQIYLGYIWNHDGHLYRLALDLDYLTKNRELWTVYTICFREIAHDKRYLENKLWQTDDGF